MGGGNPLKRVGNEVGRWGRQIDPTSSESLFGDTSNFFGNFNPASPDLDQMTGKGEPGGNASADDLSQISKALFEETDPLRQTLIGQSENFLAGNMDVTGTPMYGALKSSAEDQYGRARKNILASTPTGGGLTSALTQADLAKAGMLTRGTGDIAGRELDRATALATGTPLSASLSGLGTAGSIQAQMAAAEAQQNAATKQALGSGLAFWALA